MVAETFAPYNQLLLIGVSEKQNIKLEYYIIMLQLGLPKLMRKNSMHACTERSIYTVTHTHYIALKNPYTQTS